MLSRLCAAALCLVVLASTATATTTLYTIPEPLTFRNNSWSFGEIFTVGARDLRVTSLGAFDAEGDGFVSTGGIPVGLYREADAALLASATVTNGDALDGNFRFTDIAPVTLAAGGQYRVVALNLFDAYNITGGTFSSRATDDGFGYCEALTLTVCDTISGASLAFMANLGFEAVGAEIPLPGSLPLLAAGLGGLALARRSGTRGELRKKCHG